MKTSISENERLAMLNSLLKHCTADDVNFFLDTSFTAMASGEYFAKEIDQNAKAELIFTYQRLKDFFNALENGQEPSKTNV